MAYAKPPIIEAVVELRFASPLAFAEVEKAARRFQGSYPVDEIDFQFQAEVDAASGRMRSSKQEPVARRLSSRDRSETVSIGIASLVFGQLPPYPGWEAFSERFKADAARAKEVLGYRELSRIGVRYINRLDIPTKLSPGPPEGSVSRFLNFGVPAVPVGDSKPRAFTAQVDKNIDEKTLLTLICATVEPIVPNTWSLILDLDLSRTVDIPKRDDELWEVIEHLRKMKNEAFEACITDEARALFS